MTELIEENRKITEFLQDLYNNKTTILIHLRNRYKYTGRITHVDIANGKILFLDYKSRQEQLISFDMLVDVFALPNNYSDTEKNTEVENGHTSIS